MTRGRRLFRFPYGDQGDRHGQTKEPFAGHRRAALQAELRRLGHTLPPWVEPAAEVDVDCQWSYDTRDWEPDAATLAPARIDADPALRSPERAPVVLMHDHPSDERLFERTVEALLARGLRFEAGG